MKRTSFFDQINFYFGIHSVCGLLGPRQVGKIFALAEKVTAQGLEELVEKHFVD